MLSVDFDARCLGARAIGCQLGGNGRSIYLVISLALYCWTERNGLSIPNLLVVCIASCLGSNSHMSIGWPWPQKTPRIRLFITPALFLLAWCVSSIPKPFTTAHESTSGNRIESNAGWQRGFIPCIRKLTTKASTINSSSSTTCKLELSIILLARGTGSGARLVFSYCRCCGCHTVIPSPTFCCCRYY